MKRLQVLLLLFCLFVVTVSGQKRNTVPRKVTTTKTVSKKQPAKKTTKKQPAKKSTSTKQSASKEQPLTVKGLQSQRQQLQQQMKEQERKLRQNEQDVKKRLQNLMIINTEISDKRRTIDTIRRDINTLDGNIHVLDLQVKNLGKELNVRKDRFKKSVRYMHRNRSIQNQLMFIFSAKNFSQMYRRLRFMREYAVYQRAQGEAVQSMQQQVEEAVEELSGVKKQKNDLLYRGEQERKALENKQVEQQKVVTSLQKQQKTIQSVLEQQRQKDAALNAQIDKLIAEELARAKARAEAERKKKAAEEARKKQEAEMARKKAAAEAAARENARKIQEAKEKEAKAKAEARAAARKSEREKAAAEKAAREAENARKAAERKAADEAKAHEKEMAEAKKKSEEEWTVSSVDRQLSGNFESNRGRFPMPITGPYKIVNTQGQHRVEGLKGTTVQEMKGIELKGQSGAQARCIYDGEVSGVAGYGGSMIVIVRHGTYFSVYSDLSSVKVTRGQKVSARQIIGSVSREGTMKFQLRRISGALLNPLSWLSR
ncbi:MAG: peptidoglycan DD-metalloendopeptidase family protein [Prevotella sp.]|nr:peptidoglycan DD-metalloendopeptidase family protein [Prevotella sp.]